MNRVLVLGTKDYINDVAFHGRQDVYFFEEWVFSTWEGESNARDGLSGLAIEIANFSCFSTSFF